MSGWLHEIPTDDPAAALAFCRRLAGFASGPRADAGAAADAAPVDLSIVIPVHNEVANLPELWSRLSRTCDPLGLSWEIVAVDDGSTDGSDEFLLKQADGPVRVCAVLLTRNFGHQAAISAGLDHARGRAVVVMDSDLQDPPEMIPAFLAAWREGHEVVYAVRRARKEGWLLRQAYQIFYRLLRLISDTDIPLDAGDFCLMDRAVVDHLRRLPESTRFVRGLRSWIGLRQKGIPYERAARNAGTPTYTLRRLVSLAFSGIFAFSRMPLRLAAILGVIVSAASLGLAAFYVAKKVSVGLNPPGFATLITVMLFLSGVNLVMLGVVGEYVGRVFEEVKRRPLYLVRRVAGRTP